ncbi:hypothetical protein [Aureimonas psammosilenae]|uniref:hypothetical protein n=1 Tax=Aureimonas psammosilenae TaxID=2495496 RepID=UPI001869A0B8|nr:hypothetical protein [Aureimonas psammosilenae]
MADVIAFGLFAAIAIAFIGFAIRRDGRRGDAGGGGGDDGCDGDGGGDGGD